MIKKTPICPFCGNEMHPTLREYDSGLPVERLIIPTNENLGNMDLARKYTTVVAYVCNQCGFVALWTRKLE